EYDDANLLPAAEQNLALLHNENDEWIDITTSIDTDENIICGKTTSLSPFVLATPIIYICGDVNDDINIDILDIVYLINYKYKSGANPLCEPISICADVNHDTNIDILDIVHLINFKYKDGANPNCQ
ncbi:MAG: hypothetical protein GY865_12675, partial [candidate division Zixibacteria bacterium]|nr:hypothetical protein [candidate division Zixibacteria bacterium]